MGGAGDRPRGLSPTLPKALPPVRIEIDTGIIIGKNDLPTSVLLVHWVKAIRANRDKDWGDSLTAEDWEIIDGRILPSNWYPFEQWVRIGSALFVVAGASDLNLTRVFGLDWMRGFMDVYRNILVEGDPAASIEKFGVLRNTFYKDIPAFFEIAGKGDNLVIFKITISDYERKHGEPEGFAHQMAGAMAELVFRAGGKEINVDIKTVDDGYELHITWE